LGKPAAGSNGTTLPGAIWALMLVCFFLSGATSLVLEVVWVRLLTQVFGSTNLAISTVLATFMAGLALGSWIGGRLIDRLKHDALWAYAVCEVGVAISAFLVPIVVRGYPEINAWLWGQLDTMPLALALVRALLCALLLIIPTTFMGATLPILSRAVITSGSDFGKLGTKVAALYAINTAGAVTGAFCAGFFLLPALGLSTVHNLGVVAALVVGIIAAGLARWRNTPSRPSADKATEKPAKASVDARLALVAFAISGAVAMALEAVFSRAMALVLGSAIQSFTLVLVLFLLGISVGSAVMGRFASRSSNPLAWLAIGLTGAAGSLLLVYSCLDGLPSFHYELVRSTSVELDSAAGVGIRALVAGSIAPVTFFLGAIMPLAISAYTRSADTVGQDVGRAYAINTIGAVVGSIAGGFFILPWLGIGPGVLACALTLAAMSAVLTFRPQPKRLCWANRGAIAVIVIAAFALPGVDAKRLNEGMFGFLSSDADQWRAFQKGNELVYARDGRASTITVFENNGSFALLNNGKPDGSSHEDVHTQILLGMIPAMLHEADETDAFVIGYGTGMTVGALTQSPNIDEVDVVEIEEAVYEAADRYFSPYTHSPEKNPDVHRHVGDGRNFLMARGGQYGIIVSEPPDIWVAGVANLFSHDFYQSVQDHLLPGGIFCQWVPLYHLRPTTIQMVYRTLRRTFDHVMVFELANGNSIVIATKDELTVTMDKLERRGMDTNARRELARADIRFPVQLLTLLAFNPTELTEWAGTGRTHTDDNGALEFAAQKDYLFSIRTKENSGLLKQQLRDAFDPYGDLDGVRLDLGTGEKRKLRQVGIASELARSHRPERAQKWRERAQR
jgi:spermidine synthase